MGVVIHSSSWLLVLLCAACAVNPSLVSPPFETSRFQVVGARFVDEQQRPLQGARVHVFHGVDQVGEPLSTGADGAVWFPFRWLDQLSLDAVCIADGRELWRDRLSHLDGPTISLPKCSGRFVRAIDRETGQPLAGVAMTINVLPGVEFKTDADGRCLLPLWGDAKLGSRLGGVLHPTHAAVLEDSRLLGSIDGVNEWLLPMARREELRVTVQLPDDLHAEVVTLQVYGARRKLPLQSDTNGSFVMLPPLWLNQGMLLLVDGCWPQYLEFADAEGASVAFVAADHVKGVVRGPSGPVEDALVWAVDDEHSEIVLTDALGGFHIKASNGSRIRVAAVGLRTAEDFIKVESAEHLDPIVLKPAAMMKITLPERPDSMLPGGVAVYRQDGKNYKRLLGRDVGNTREVRLDGLAPGTYLVTWGVGGVGVGTEKTVLVTATDTVVEVELELPDQ
ncbi:MAG: hypothetical protein ACI85K_002141 [Hyphomicrobiaceae bacterium]